MMPQNTHANADTVRTRVIRGPLNDAKIRSLHVPSKGSSIEYDAKLAGFGVRVTSGGSKSFILNYRFKGRERRITIGQFPAWSCIAARRQAQFLRREIDLGSDPLAERIGKRAAPTVRELYERYCVEHLPTKAARSAADDKAMWRNDILPNLGATKVADLTPRDCDNLHMRIAKDRPIRANRVLEVLRKALNLSIRWGWIDRNPASGCRRSVERKRHRYLLLEQVAKLASALAHHPQSTSADALLFMLFTGCRRGEALNARWDQFDLERRVWTKASSETKQRREHRVPYSHAVSEILERRRAESVGPHIFPGRLGAPLQEVRKTWDSVCEEAGLSGVRIHDLRHTFASLVASSGQSLFVVGELLGHASTETTKRYANLYDHALRQATDSVAIAILADSGPSAPVSRTSL